MSARDELTTLILGKTAPRAADAILTAGYRKVEGVAAGAPAEAAMTDICANLEEFFAGQQSPEVALAAICQISGRYKMESIK